MSLNQTSHDVESISKSLQYFGVTDYIIFGIMLMICSCIGVYFGYKDHQKKKRSHSERRGSEAMNYLVGGKSLHPFPVAMSLVATWISGFLHLFELFVY